MADLRAVTRDLVKQMERDPGTRIDWVALDHRNPDHPHLRLMVLGATERGDTLIIHGDYISHGLRERAAELVTIELGPQGEHECAVISLARSAPIAERARCITFGAGAVENGYAHQPVYVQRFLHRELGFAETAVVFNLADLLSPTNRAA